MKQNTHHIPTILIIDRDEDDCLFFKEAITEVSPGTKVVFWKGKECIWELIKLVCPTLIFIECKLPGENGIDRLRQLKEHPDFRAIPVVAWSTGRLGPVVTEAYAAGAQLYLEKPWEIKVWVNKVRMIVHQFHKGKPVFLQPARNAYAPELPKATVPMQDEDSIPAVQIA
ncbi:response regulator [Paraflavisolibacter sp. H34]|uniref:response regulator n=1 Tax=Huijunlia imazamoxiresistens TaxID=3127457 RepID=UPI003015A744